MNQNTLTIKDVDLPYMQEQDQQRTEKQKQEQASLFWPQTHSNNIICSLET